MALAQDANHLDALLGDAAIPRHLLQPAFEGAATHARHAGVEQRKQRGAVLAAQGLHQLQIAPRRQGNIHQLSVKLHAQAADMRELRALSVFGIGQQSTCCRLGMLKLLRAKCLQTGDLKLGAKFLRTQTAVKLEGGAQGER